MSYCNTRILAFIQPNTPYTTFPSCFSHCRSISTASTSYILAGVAPYSPSNPSLGCFCFDFSRIQKYSIPEGGGAECSACPNDPERLCGRYVGIIPPPDDEFTPPGLIVRYEPYLARSMFSDPLLSPLVPAEDPSIPPPPPPPPSSSPPSPQSTFPSGGGNSGNEGSTTAIIPSNQIPTSAPITSLAEFVVTSTITGRDGIATARPFTIISAVIVTPNPSTQTAVTIPSPPPTPDSTSPTNTSVVLAAIVSASIVVVAAVVGLIVIRRNRREEAKKDTGRGFRWIQRPEPSLTPSSDSTDRTTPSPPAVITSSASTSIDVKPPTSVSVFDVKPTSTASLAVFPLPSSKLRSTSTIASVASPAKYSEKETLTFSDGMQKDGTASIMASVASPAKYSENETLAFSEGMQKDGTSLTNTYSAPVRTVSVGVSTMGDEGLPRYEEGSRVQRK
ncbi:hypothetical protein BC829DRAFT_390642 [Chytridium lagenaria]|nr:hypothetical protein BC829DRAFT_390642 [Chytridium lagenaria]